MEFLFDQALLIEDEPAHALLITRALKEAVRTIHQKGTRKDALQFLESEEGRKVSLVISDLNLPDGKELEIVQPILSTIGDIPLVVLTSSTSVATAIASMKVGARDYLVKNFGPEFKDTLQLALQRVSVSMNYQRERKRLEREMAILRLAVENGTDGVALLHPNGTITYCNTAFTEYAEKLKGSTLHIKDFFEHAATDNHLCDTILERLTSSAIWTTAVETKKEFGVTLKLELSKLSENDDHEQVFALWIRDISEAKRRERLQKEILSTTTHDLKGPLGAILLSSELISQKPENVERVKEISIRIASSAQGAVNIIDEFLSARRIQEGTFTLKPKPIPISELFQELEQNYQPMIRAKSLQLQMKIPQDFTIQVDKLGMTRVLGNLLSNAIKFTAKNGIIAMEATMKDDKYSMKISDTGAGMEPQEARKLFERYSRLKRHDDIEGTGLGLFVVKSIVEAHGGIVSVTSAIGQGTSFDLSLPINPPMNAQGEVLMIDF